MPKHTQQKKIYKKSLQSPKPKAKSQQCYHLSAHCWYYWIFCGKKTAKFTPNFTDWQNSSNLPTCSGQKISWNELLMLKKSIQGLKMHRGMGMWQGGMWSEEYGLSGFGINPLNNEICWAAELNFKKNRSIKRRNLKLSPKPHSREHTVHPWIMDINPLEWCFPRSGRMEEKYFLPLMLREATNFLTVVVPPQDKTFTPRNFLPQTSIKYDF